MRNDQQPLNENLRSQQRAKRRKTNIILNSLIIIVVLLIVIVTINIFFGDDNKANSNTEGKSENITKQESGAVSASSQSDNKTDSKDSKDTNKNDSKNADSKDSKQSSDDKKASEEDKKTLNDKKDQEDIKDQPIVTEGGSDPQVKKTIVNPAWQPVGTVQTGQHSNVYSGVDWDEMVKAISYGTGLAESNMTILYLGNNGPNKSVGTIKQKDTKQEYRVYIEWVDEKGWKPTLVEER